MSWPGLDFLWGLGFWNWFFLAILLMALETFVPGVHFLWFGLAAAIVGALAYLAIVLGLADFFGGPFQLVAFALISVVTVFGVRGWARAKTARSDEPNLNIRGAQYVGRIVTVEDAIAGGRGKVRVGDTVWPAQGTDSAKGARVKVTGVNGNVLVVEPA